MLSLKIQMHPYAVPIDSLGIELSVGRWSCIIFRKELDLTIADAGVFKLNSGIDGPSDLPVRPLIALEIRIADRTYSSSPIGTGARQFDAPLSRATAQVLWLASNDVPAAPIQPQPREEFVGQFDIDFLVAEIHPGDSRVVQKKLITQMGALMLHAKQCLKLSHSIAAQKTDSIIGVDQINGSRADVENTKDSRLNAKIPLSAERRLISINGECFAEIPGKHF